MGRIRLLLALLLFSSVSLAQGWTYVSTSAFTSPDTATYDVAVGNFIVVTVFATSPDAGWPSTITDSAGNTLTSLVVPGVGSTHGFINGPGVDLNCPSPFAFFNPNQETWYYGFASHAGTGVTFVVPIVTPQVNYVDAQIFSTSYIWAEEDWSNSFAAWDSFYTASPAVLTPGNSDELWITTAFRINADNSTAIEVPTATTALTAVGGSSYNYYSIPSGTQTFTYPPNDTTSCPNPPFYYFDHYFVWFSTIGFHGATVIPSTAQPHVSTWLGD